MQVDTGGVAEVGYHLQLAKQATDGAHAGTSAHGIATHTPPLFCPPVASSSEPPRAVGDSGSSFLSAASVVMEAWCASLGREVVISACRKPEIRDLGAGGRTRHRPWTSEASRSLSFCFGAANCMGA